MKRCTSKRSGPVQGPLRTRPQLQQQGLTIIELMIGLALGLVVTAALMMMFSNASANSQNLARAGLQIENGRYVSELLREDLRMAGFIGEAAIDGAVYAAPNPCDAPPTGWLAAPYTLPVAIQGIGPLDVPGCLANRKAGTHAIALRRLDTDTVDPATLTAANAQFYLQYSFCAEDAGPRLVFGKAKAAFVLRDRACTGINTVRAYQTRIYYVASCSVCGTDTIPTLKRMDLVGSDWVTTSVAEGIDNLRFEYGFDTDNNGNADEYRTGLSGAGATNDWSNVMTVKAHFITRSLEKALGQKLATAQVFQLGDTEVVKTAADGYTRRVYSSAIRIINPSSAREVQ